ncbi:CARDB domain-containing protein [Methanothermococcus thermolithotrophicus]|uniref:CARDB domain-containing protein n=1 Tax=Methanothermococcus thermolithotrophicus TaxID=2186 RepID=UPI00035ECF30|nr:CARDB domain-containing protein [Methanothermococcus thermolithotrophicus]
MKWKFFTLSVLMISLIGMCYAEDVSVELVPDNVNAYTGDSFNLDLVVKNVPNDTGCEGFETYINYNSSMMNISESNIVLKDISGHTTKDDITVSNGKIWISLWFSNSFTGNFTIATLSFNTLNEGSGAVSLSGTVMSDVNGFHIEPLTLKNSNITILLKPIADIITPATVSGELGENITVPIIISPKENETLSEISGTLSYDKTIITPVNISSSAGTVLFNTSNDFFKIDGLNKSTNFTVNITYNIINVGNTTTQLKDVTIKDNESYSVVKNSDITKIIIPGSDLTITDILVSNLKSYQNNTISITIKNIGERNASNNFSVVLYIDSQDLGTKTITGLNVGETKNINFTFMPIENKNYTIVTVVDSNGEIKEINENNNKYIKTVESVEEPIALNLIPSTNLTKTDETFTVNISLDSITANRPVKGMDGVLTYDSKILECANFTFLINASENLKNITFEDGKVVFSIMDGSINTSTTIAKATFKALDVGNSEIGLDGVVVSDINGYKFNNIVINPKTVVVQGPNIKIIDMEISNPSIYRMPTTINITLTNNGHQDIANKSFDVHLYIDSKDLGVKTVDSLNIGETKTVSFNWTPDDTRIYTIVAVVDKSNVIKEENESDNKLVKNLKVVEVPVYLKLYNTSETNGTIVASIDTESISSKRPCSGYDINLTFKNIEILNVSGIGIVNWSVNNDSLFISGYNFTESGKFNIGNITFKLIDENNTYSVILKHATLSDCEGYKFKKIFINNTIMGKELKEALKHINMDSEALKDVDLDNVKIISGKGLNITVIPVKNDSIEIPHLENISINFTGEHIKTLKEVTQKATELKNTKINDENEMNKTIDNILSEVKPILNEGFNITNITKEEAKKENNKLISTIKFKAINTSNKGFSIIRIPIGTLDVEDITVNNGTENITLKENDITGKIGWYRIPVEGVLEITLVKDPEVNIILAAALPTTETTKISSTSSGSRHRAVDKYPNVADDIKSEKIKEIVHKYKLIIGSETDDNLSAKCLKNTTELVNKSLGITEDCILVGGPVANPLVKKYAWTFKVKVTNDYPGAHKGVIQKQLINGHTVILLAGSDRWGTKAAVEYFKTLDDIPDEPVFVEWQDDKVVKIEKP